MDQTIIKQYIKDNQLITGLYQYFQKQYQEINDADKKLFQMTFSQNLKSQLEDIIYHQKLNLEIPIIKEFYSIFSKLQNSNHTRHLYQHFLFQFSRNSSNIINTIANDTVVYDDPAKIFFNIVDLTTQKEIQKILLSTEKINIEKINSMDLTSQVAKKPVHTI